MSENKKCIAVIGGGASGCMAALAAAREGSEVFLFEKNEKIAKKIYATGNGKCNITNLALDQGAYHTGGGPEEQGQILSALADFPPKKLVSFFEEAGVSFFDRDGYVYPRTEQAETIALALEKELGKSRVHVMTSCRVTGISSHASGRFILSWAMEASKSKFPVKDPFQGGTSKSRPAKRGRPQKQLSREDDSHGRGLTGRRVPENAQPEGGQIAVDAVILSTGGMVNFAFGCTGDGYRMAETFSHTVRTPLPALTQLVCKDRIIRRAAGVRCQAAVCLYADCGPASVNIPANAGLVDSGTYDHAGLKDPGISGVSFGPAASPACPDSYPEPVCREEGELQITDYGISGIPVMQLSGTAARMLHKGRSVRAVIDFLPWMNAVAFAREKKRRLLEDRNQTLRELLLGLVHRKVIDLVLAGKDLQAEMKARRLDDAALEDLLDSFRCLSLEISQARSFENAQVTAGGVPLSEIGRDFQSLCRPGLYLTGELLDVDGRCGGYNLQWAMTSGYLAGKAAGQAVRQGDL